MRICYCLCCCFLCGGVVDVGNTVAAIAFFLLLAIKDYIERGYP
jgi:hypothetical protein